MMRHRALLAAAALVAATLLTYAPATRCGYIWDDDRYVESNPTLRSAEGLGAIWTSVWATPQYYPLVHTSYWIEYHIWGADPFGAAHRAQPTSTTTAPSGFSTC